jgi:hypothetical protein
VFSPSEGDAVIHWPAPLSADSISELEDCLIWLSAGSSDQQSNLRAYRLSRRQWRRFLLGNRASATVLRN